MRLKSTLADPVALGRSYCSHYTQFRDVLRNHTVRSQGLILSYHPDLRVAVTYAPLCSKDIGICESLDHRSVVTQSGKGHAGLERRCVGVMC